MNLITAFRNIVNGFGSPSPEFIYASMPRAVELLDNIEGSTVLYIEPSDGYLDIGQTSQRAEWKVELVFIELSEKDIEAEDRYVNLAKAITNAQKFVEAYNALKLFDLLQGEIEMRRIPEGFSNAPITGVAISFNCKPNDRICA